MVYSGCSTGYELAVVEPLVETVPEEEEQIWLPNPYQAQADAQMLAGAWPGAFYLIPSVPGMPGTPYYTTDMSPQAQMSETGSESSPFGCGDMGDMTPWGYYIPVYENEQYQEPAKFNSNERSRLLTGSTTCDSTDEGDASAEQPDSAHSADDENAIEAAEECDDFQSTLSTTRFGKGTRKLSHQSVPKNTNLSQAGSANAVGEGAIEEGEITTLMIRNIPNMYTRSMLMEELDALDFQNEYDFIYVPIDKSTQWNVGYAFVNFKSAQVAARCMQVVTNYTFTRFEHGSGKVAQVSIAHIQGLERNMEYYAKTAVQCARIQTHRPLQLNSKHKDAAIESSRKAHRRRRRMHGEAQGMEEEAHHWVASSQKRTYRYSAKATGDVW